MELLASLARDLHFSLRQMRHTPIVSIVALLSLALGIGANVAIFSLVNALMLKALPVYEPERLVLLGFASERGPNTSFTNPQWEYLRDHQDIFTGIAATSFARFNLNASGEMRPVPGLYVSGRFFDALGVTQDQQMEIVGLVANAMYRTLREEAPPTVYVSFAQQARISSFSRLAIRTTGPPMAAREAVLAAVGSVNKEIVLDLKTLDEDLGANLLQERLIASLSAFFGGLALLLAALGLYGVMSYSVTRRKSEIGIRMALGAEPHRVVRLVLGHVALITIAGLVVGAVASIGAGRFINALLFNLATTDTTMMVMTAATLAAAAAIAGYLPARRAARIDPTVALRED